MACNFTDALWTIPARRMKRRNPHNVYLSRQALDMFVALRTCAGTSPYILPSRYDPDVPMNGASLDRKGRPNYPTDFKRRLAIEASTPGISVSKLAQQNGTRVHFSVHSSSRRQSNRNYFARRNSRWPDGAGPTLTK